MSKECEEGGFYMRWSRAAEGMTRVLGMFMESKPNRSITSRLDRDGLTIVGSLGQGHESRWGPSWPLTGARARERERSPS